MKRDAKSQAMRNCWRLGGMTITGKSRLDGYDLWVTLNHVRCAPGHCACTDKAAVFCRNRSKGGAVESGIRFFDAPTCHHRPEIYGGIQAAAAQQLLTDFFAVRR